MSETYASAVQAPPVIDTFGNMNLHAAGGQLFAFRMQNPDGTLALISSFLYVFKVSAAGASVPLTLGPDNYTQFLTIPDGVFGLSPGSANQWVILDVTNMPEVPVRSGILNVYGFIPS